MQHIVAITFTIVVWYGASYLLSNISNITFPFPPTLENWLGAIAGILTAYVIFRCIPAIRKYGEIDLNKKG